MRRRTRTEAKTVMTVRIDETVAKDLSALMRALGLRRDTYLSPHLADAVESLTRAIPNSARASSYIKSRESRPGKHRVKLGLKLAPALIARINEVCEEKRIPRDLFVETFLAFLARGFQHPAGGAFESFASPLAVASSYLDDPYRGAGPGFQPSDILARCLVPEATLDIDIALAAAESRAQKVPRQNDHQPEDDHADDKPRKASR